MHKKFKILLSALALTVLFAVPVAAATMSFSFSVDMTEDMDDVQYSSNTQKDSSSSTARVEYHDSNITTSDDFCFYVVDQNGNNTIYSERVFTTANEAVLYPNYTKTTKQGNYYRLAGQTYAYYVYVNGDWTP